MVNGDYRAYHLTRSGEASAVLGDFEEAKKQLLKAISSRPCDMCNFSGCIDAYNGLIYLACLQDDMEAAAEYQAKAQEILPDDYDAKHIIEQFATKKKKGLFR